MCFYREWCAILSVWEPSHKPRCYGRSGGWLISGKPNEREEGAAVCVWEGRCRFGWRRKQQQQQHRAHNSLSRTAAGADWAAYRSLSRPARKTTENTTTTANDSSSTRRLEVQVQSVSVFINALIIWMSHHTVHVFLFLPHTTTKTCMLGWLVIGGAILSRADAAARPVTAGTGSSCPVKGTRKSS